MDSIDTADIYELIVERHRAASTVITSNREPVEWLGLMADPLLAQSAIDRLQSAAHELVLDGESYRQRQKPTVTDNLDEPTPPRQTSHRRTYPNPGSGPHPLAKGCSTHELGRATRRGKGGPAYE